MSHYKLDMLRLVSIHGDLVSIQCITFHEEIACILFILAELSCLEMDIF